MVKHNEKIFRQKLTNCLSVFDNFVGLALQGLRKWGFHWQNYCLISWSPICTALILVSASMKMASNSTIAKITVLEKTLLANSSYKGKVSDSRPFILV